MAALVQKAQEFFAGASALVMTENSYMPHRNGTRLRVTKVGKSYAEGTVLNGERKGRDFRVTIPTRARDVVSLGGDTISFLLDVPSQPGQVHTVTYRREVEWPA